MKDKKKKALAITWDDSDLSSSDEEEDQEEEHQANMCFMGLDNEDQVSPNVNEELLDAFNELFLKFKQLNSSYKILKNENKNLNNALISPHISEINNLKEMNHSLFSENKKLTNNNHFLKSECDSLKCRISDLDLNVSSLKSKYEIISKNVGKFNKGKENLNNLLSYQLSTNYRHGLGYSSKINVASSTFNMQKKNHALLYSRFVKSNSYANNDMKTNYMHVSHNSKIMHDKNVSRKINYKSNFIWVPKNECMNDRNLYILDFKNKVCNSENYISYNIGKPNSYWVWFPKV
jgi:hypothetical protein